MKLFLQATSERGKPVTKSGNEYIEMILTENREPMYGVCMENNHFKVWNYKSGVILYEIKPKTAREEVYKRNCEICGGKYTCPEGEFCRDIPR